jgi:hypothetical protein
VKDASKKLNFIRNFEGNAHDPYHVLDYDAKESSENTHEDEACFEGLGGRVVSLALVDAGRGGTGVLWCGISHVVGRANVDLDMLVSDWVQHRGSPRRYFTHAVFSG